MIVVGCSSSGDGGTGGNGSGGTAGEGGAGAAGGMGGMGGFGGSPRMCVNPRDCDDREVCTIDRCAEQICEYEVRPDQTLCATSTRLSECLDGVCQTIRSDCAHPNAVDGELCEPSPRPNPSRLGRCEGGTCTISPCTVAIECWDQEPCHIGLCDLQSGTCSQDNRPDGTGCTPPLLGVCLDGACVSSGAGGEGGSGGQGGEGGASGRGGSGGN